MIGETDKSNKLVIVDKECYDKMGRVHTCKDTRVHMEEVEVLAKTHYQHMSMLLKILKLGHSWGHRARFRESCLGGQNPSVMYLAIKDDKPKACTRPGQLWQTTPATMLACQRP